jgi:hypothetical protein
MKRTYNISPESIATVKSLVEEHHLARSQDELVEHAISELARRVRDADEEALWSMAAKDPEFQEEAKDLDMLFAEDDAAAWRE